MRLNFSRIVFISGCLLALGACSSSKHKDSEPDAIPPAAAAGTDAVPQASPELSNSAQVNQAQQSFPAPSSSSSGLPEDYAVKDGDTLMKIAFEIYGDVYKWKNIYEANKALISNPNSILKGTVIKVERPAIPPSVNRTGEQYLIQQGDTLGSISNTLFGSPSHWKALWEYNKQLIHDPNKIFAGFYLYYLKNIEELKGPVSDAKSVVEGDQPSSGVAKSSGSSAIEDNAPQGAAEKSDATDGSVPVPAPPSASAGSGDSIPVVPSSN